MPDQTIALQLNIDTNAPDAIDQVKQKITELQDQLANTVENTKEFTDALSSLGSAKDLLSDLTKAMDAHKDSTEANTVALGKYNNALTGLSVGRTEFEELSKSMNAINPDAMAGQFVKFGDTASTALKGIGAAAVLATQNNADLAKIIDKATDAATKAGPQKIALLQKNNTDELKLSESFEQSNLDVKTKYQSLELSGLEQTAQEKKKILDSEFSNAKSGADALSSLADLMVENGKKNTEAQKATALIQIGIDTAKAISSLVAASNENPANAATSGVAGVIQFAAGVVEILANVAKAKDILAGGDSSSTGSSGSSASAPALSAASTGINTSAPVISPPAQPGSVAISRNTTSNTMQQGTIKAYVLESEITKSQQRATTLKNQSMH